MPKITSEKKDGEKKGKVIHKNLDKVIEKVENDITMNKVLIGYLESTSFELSKEAKAKLDMKVDALKRDIMFNEGFIIYAKNL